MPLDIEAKSGTSKRDLILVIFSLLKQTRIEGINQDTPVNFDYTAVQNQIKEFNTRIDTLGRRQRVVTLAGVNNQVLIVPFEKFEDGFTNYSVDVVFVAPDGNINTCTWAIVEGTKTDSQVQIRIDGSASHYNLEITITERK